MAHSNSLKNKTIGGLLWSFGEMLGNQGFQFFIQIILARLLLPEHFGLVGMITVFIALSNSFADSGFAQALIREQNATQKDYSTVFYFNMVVSLAMYLILYVSAPYISNFFNEAELVPILRILSLLIVIHAIAIIPRAIFIKEINFKVQAKINLTASLLAGGLAVAMALSGFGVWSLIARTLATTVLQTLFLVIAKRWVPSWIFSIESFKRLFGFSWKLLISSLLNTSYKNIYFLIIGKQYSASSLGFYTNSYKLSDLTTYTLTTMIERVSYPVLSTIQNENDRLKHAFRRIVKLAAFIIFPVMAGLAAIADPLIRLIFGEQWIPMIVYFQILCIAGILYPITVLNLNILQVKGRTDLFLYLELAKLAISSLLIVIVIWMSLGMLYLVGVVLLDSFIALLSVIYFSGKELSYPAREQLKDLTPFYLISFIMGVIVLNIGKMMPYNDFILLIVQVSTGISFFIISCKLLKIPELSNVYSLLVPVFKKIKVVLTN